VYTTSGESLPGNTPLVGGKNVAAVFTPQVNVSIGPNTVQLGANSKSVCGFNDNGLRVYNIQVLGNYTSDVVDPSVAKPVNVIRGNTTDSLSIKANDYQLDSTQTFVMSVGTEPYYNVIVAVTPKTMTITVQIYTSQFTTDPWDPRNIGKMYHNNPDFTFAPGAVFQIKCLNDQTGAFPTLGSNTRMTAANLMYTSNCLDGDPTGAAKYSYTCPKGSTVVMDNNDFPEEMFTFDAFTNSDGMYMMLRNLKYGYVYMSPQDAAIDSDVYSSKVYTVATVDVSRTGWNNDPKKYNADIYGQWTVIPVGKTTRPSTAFWWDACNMSNGYNIGLTPTWTKDLNDNLPLAKIAPLFYLIYKPSSKSTDLYCLQTGCLEMYKEIGLSSKAGCTAPPSTSTQVLVPDHSFTRNNCTGCTYDKALPPFEASGGPQIQNSRYVFSSLGSVKISKNAVTLPNGPVYLSGTPPTVQYWSNVMYNIHCDGVTVDACKGCINGLWQTQCALVLFASPLCDICVACACRKYKYDGFFYESQAVNTNFYFDLIADGNYLNALSNSPTYSEDCYARVPFDVPFAVLDSDAGKVTCPTWAIQGFPKLAPATAPASCSSEGDTKTGVSKCYVPDNTSSMALHKDRVAAAGAFLTEVCVQKYQNGSSDNVTCLNLMDQTSASCSGFRSANYADACKFACEQDPDTCDRLKIQYCSQPINKDTNDCACTNVNSPFLNTSTELTSDHGVTLKQYRQTEDLATDNSAFFQCWWHPCVLDPYPALQPANACKIKSYTDCVNTAKSVNIGGVSAATIKLYNACYQTYEQSSTNDANTGTVVNNVFDTGDGGAPGAGPVDEPPAVKKLSKGAIAGIVLGVIAFLILAGVGGYYLFRTPPRRK